MGPRIAVINCSPPGSYFVHGGKKYTASELLAMRAREAGAEPKIFWPAKDGSDFPALDEFDALLIPGSRLDIDGPGRKANPWMEDLIRLIRNAHAEEKPMLGICFGHQAIGVAFGCSIGRIPRPQNLEIGLVPLELTDEGAEDGLFNGVPRRFDAMMWHYRFIEPAPEGAVVLAKGTAGMIQSFRIGKSTWGVQFHPDYAAEDLAQKIRGQKAALAKETDLSAVRLDGPRKDALVLDNFFRLAMDSAKR